MFSAINNLRPKSSAFGITSASSSLETSESKFPCKCLYEEPPSIIHDLFLAAGSQGTTSTNYQGSRHGFSATEVVERPNNRGFLGKIQSISAMPIYEDQSHRDLRSEDYGLCYKGGQTLWGDLFSRSQLETSDTASNIFRFAPLSNHSSVPSLFQPLKSCFSELKAENSITPNSTISTAPTLASSMNPFSCSPQLQAFTLQPATASFGPTSNLTPPSLIPFTMPMLKNSREFPKLSTTFSSSSVGTFSFTKPSVIASSSIKSTPSSDTWSSIMNASQPQQTAEKVGVGPLSTNDLHTPSQASSGLTTVTQFTSQDINGQQYIASRNSSMQSSLVVNPFATRFPINQPTAETSRLHGISSLPVSNNLSSNRRASLLRIRHVSSTFPGIPTQKPNGRSSETKVPFFIDEEDKPGPVAHFLPRENPRAWVNISSSSLHSPRDSKGDRVKNNSSSLQVTERMSEDTSTLLKQHEDEVAATTEANVVALMPKLPDGDEYYTEPPLHELAAKEMAEAGFCRHVKDFVVGRQGYGSIKFLGETDIRHLDVESIVQFNNRQVVVYPDERKKPRVGQQLNKAAELTLLNVKCINKKIGKQYVEGHQVEGYKEMLIKKAQEQGAEFVSYDPVEGEWKFRVQHF